MVVFSNFFCAQSAAGERFTVVMKFSPDLTFRVADALQRLGYCIFGINELERLFGQTKDSKGRMHLLSEGFVAIYSLVESIYVVRSMNEEVYELTASIIVKPPDINAP